MKTDSELANDIEQSTLAERIAVLESQLEELSEIIEGCRKAMLIAKVLMAGGGVLIVAALTGLFHDHPMQMIGGLAGMIAGIVWFGANRTTLLQAQAKSRAFESLRSELIGLVSMRTIH